MDDKALRSRPGAAAVFPAGSAARLNRPVSADAAFGMCAVARLGELMACSPCWRVGDAPGVDPAWPWTLLGERERGGVRSGCADRGSIPVAAAGVCAVTKAATRSLFAFAFGEGARSRGGGGGGSLFGGTEAFDGVEALEPVPGLGRE